VPENALHRIRECWPGVFLSADDATFDAAVRSYMRAARDHDLPIERTIAMLKLELRSLTPIDGNVGRADELIQRAVQIVIAEYFDPHN
jgi:hypothetical protein